MQVTGIQGARDDAIVAITLCEFVRNKDVALIDVVELVSCLKVANSTRQLALRIQIERPFALARRAIMEGIEADCAMVCCP
jgi:hypothetical protein